MERDKCRKRGREDHNTKDSVMNNAKKLDLNYMDEYLDKDKENRCENETHDDDPFMPVGVFDFPWLKEAVIFKTEEPSGFEDINFASGSCSCSYLDDTSTATAGFEFSGHAPPALLITCRDDKFEDKQQLSESFQVDKFDLDLDGADYCIWSSVLDQPLINGFNNI